MSFTRRSFLKSGAITALTAGIALNSGSLVFGQGRRQSNPSLDFQVPFQAQQSPVFYFKRETFQPYVGGIFRISAGRRSVNATLQEVRDCTPSPNGSKLTKKSRPSDCFALVFRASGPLTDLTSIYDIQHAALGKFSLFLTQHVGPRTGARTIVYYEAVINHTL
jgi:hypothetical protein